MEVVRKCSDILHDNIGVSIFGFDILVQVGTGDFVIIDLNQFPGFKEIADLSTLMRDHIITTFNRGYS